MTQLHDLLEEGRQPPISTQATGNGVQIMSVHRSKGLEFPVVILADLHKRFNADDFHRPVLVHPQLGLGTERVDRQRRIRYDTVTKSAVAAALTSGVHQDIQVADPVPLYFQYITGWATPNGTVQFRDDIYQRDGLGGLPTGDQQADAG